MMKADNCVSLVPYFKIHEGKVDEFKAGCAAFFEATVKEPSCIYYGFTFDGDNAHCREGYADAAGVLAHLENVGALLGEALKIADISRLEVHGPESEIDKLRGPMADLSPQFFISYGEGFRK